MKRRIVVIIILIVAVAAGLYYWTGHREKSLVLTGIVSTDEVRVGAQVQGRVQKLLVRQGDMVKKGQLLAVLQPRQWLADQSYYENLEKESAALVTEAASNLDLQTRETRAQILQAKAGLATAKAQARQAEADLELSRLTFERAKTMRAKRVNSEQDYDKARTGYAAARAHAEALEKQVKSAMAAVALAKANADQVASRRAALIASTRHLAAARAQAEKATVLLGYTKIYAPIDGIVDVRPVLQGEVVTAGQTIVTLVDPDDLWVRADVAESYIDRIRIGEKLTVRLPSGATRVGTVFYRGVDADYATQRDVSRTKRDIKTFQVRLRCNNRDRAMALGMTAYVVLPME